MIIQKVKDYNREAYSKYLKAVNEWNPNTGGFPCIGMYLFYTPQGNKRQRGFVISEGKSHYFRLTRGEVTKFKA